MRKKSRDTEPIDFARRYESQALTKAEASYARKIIEAKRWGDAPCFERSQRLFLSASGIPMDRLDRLAGEEDVPVPPVPRGMALRYVEGFSDVPPMKTRHFESFCFQGEHAWLTLNGKVIDVTWEWQGHSIAGEFSGITYFGREFTEDDLIDFFDSGLGGTTDGVPDEEVDTDGDGLGLCWRMVDRFYWADSGVINRCLKMLELAPKQSGPSRQVRRTRRTPR